MQKRLLLKTNLLIAIVAATVCAQTFEVASITPWKRGKPAGSFMRGGPGSKDPELLTAQSYPLKFIVMRAYDLPDYRVAAPDWPDRARFNIQARVPKDANKEQFRVMLQNLLVERFQMKVHFEKREMPLYELSVAKGGAKFGLTSFAVIRDHCRSQWANQPIAQLVSFLSGNVQAPMVDRTGLTGNYDFVLSWIDPSGTQPARIDSGAPLAAADPSGPTLESALLSQLGLKLEKKKGPVDLLVVDSAEKIPTEN